MSGMNMSIQMKFDNIASSEMQDILVDLHDIETYLEKENNYAQSKNYYEFSGDVSEESTYINVNNKIEELLSKIEQNYLKVGFYSLVSVYDSVTDTTYSVYKKYPGSSIMQYDIYENEDISFFDIYDKDRKYQNKVAKFIKHAQKFLIYFNENYYCLNYKDCIDILNDGSVSLNVKSITDEDVCDLLAGENWEANLSKYIISKEDAQNLIETNHSEKLLATNIIDYLNDSNIKKIALNYFENLEIENFSSFEELLSSFMVENCESALEFWEEILSKNKSALSEYYPYCKLVYEPVLKWLENDRKKNLIEALVKDTSFRDILLAVFDFTLPNNLYDEEVNLVRYKILKEISLQGYHELFIKIMGNNLLTWEDKVLERFLEEAQDSSGLDTSICIDVIKTIKNIPLSYSRLNYLIGSELLYRQLDCYLFEIAGTQYRDKKILKKYAEEDVIVKLVPEPTNEYDKNAIRVETESKAHLGYVPRFMASEIQNVEMYSYKIAAVHVTVSGKYIIVVEAVPKDMNIF